jgi:hypothetical protein
MATQKPKINTENNQIQPDFLCGIGMDVLRKTIFRTSGLLIGNQLMVSTNSMVKPYHELMVFRFMV